MKIALHVVATGRYVEFVPPIVESAKQFFLTDHDVRVLVRTERPVPGTEHVQGGWAPWPLPTLLKYHYLSEIGDRLAEFDYVFQMDADMYFVGDVGNEILADRVGAQHSAFYDKPRDQFTYETRSDSRACVRPDEGTHYFQATFFGGRLAPFMEMVEELRRWTEEDLNNRMIPIWFDESYLNRYFIDHPPFVLSPSYCFPRKVCASWNLKFEPKIVAIFDKDAGALHQRPF